MSAYPEALVEGIAAIISGAPSPSTRSVRKAERIFDFIEADKHGKTPHALRREAEAEVERLRALIDRILDYSAFTHAQQVEYRRKAGL